MNFKILCSDLDGTLLSTKNDVSEFTISQINRIKHRTRVILVSARMPKSITYLQKRMGIEEHPIISYNGALILEKGKVLHNTTIPIAKTLALHTICMDQNIRLGLYRHDDWFVSETSERVEKEIFNTKVKPTFEPTQITLKKWQNENLGVHKIMLMGSKENIDGLSLILDTDFSSEMNSYRSNDTLIEIAPKSSSKLSGIKSILKPEETLKEVIAFGDNYNDVEMLRSVGFGVAVSNARKEAKEAANKVTLSNKEHGVAQFIKDHL
ncbi:HAD family hydrolase [Flagellimonas sp. S3867]|uniref:HAD family hydrolase n=1 Tax=Flagellimonas sp. S3867 TaxID=2768063 RepID=UPI00168881B2|nr:HAD family hydrolase [Flagellimonas sp. S3867]